MSALLRLRGLGVAFGESTVLADVTLELPRTGLFSLVGPAGSGKSTLLRTIAGVNDAHPALSTWGEALFDGRPLARGDAGEVRAGIGLVTQHARFFLDSVRENLVSAFPDRALLDPASQRRKAEDVLRAHGLGELVPGLERDVASLPTPVQRRLAIVRALLADPMLLLADEPVAGLDDDHAIDALALLRAEASVRCVVFVTHNQRIARVTGGSTILLAGGRIREIAPARTFFSAPRTPAGVAFVATGGCRDASPRARREDLDSSTPPHAAGAERPPRSRFEGPRGFFWVKAGELGGLPRPGIVAAVEQDLEGLRHLGVGVLVTLEEAETVDRDLLARFEIAGVHFPIADMGVPELATAAALCRDVAATIARRVVVAMHCRGGLGRTGTMLASQLVFEGTPAREAIERVRRLEPRSIQSSAQVEFLSSLEAFLRRGRVPAVETATPTEGA